MSIEEEKLCNVDLFTDKVLAELDKTGWVGEPPSKGELFGLNDRLRIIMVDLLSGYNKKHEQKLHDFNDFKEASAGKIAGLEIQVKDLEDQQEAAIVAATESLKNERREIITRADANEAEFEAEKEKMVKRKAEMRAEIDKHIKTARDAREDRDNTYKLLDEKEVEIGKLKREINKLKKSIEDMSFEIRGRRSETQFLSKEADEKQKEAKKYLAELNECKKQNQGLRERVTGLGRALVEEEKNCKKLAKMLQDTRNKLSDREEELHNLKASSGSSSPTSGTSAQGMSLADELGGTGFGDDSDDEERILSRPGSAGAAAAGILEQELQDLREENTRHQAEVETLKEDLAKERNNCAELNKKIDTLQKRVATLEAEQEEEAQLLKNITESHQKEAESAEKELAEEKNNREESTRKINALEKKIAALKAEHEKETQRLTSENADCQATVQGLKADLAKDKDRHDESNEKIKDLKQKIAALETKHKEETQRLQDEAASYERDLETLKKELDGEKAHFNESNEKAKALEETLQKMEADHEQERQQLHSSARDRQAVVEKLKLGLSREREVNTKLSRDVAKSEKRATLLEAETNRLRADVTAQGGRNEKVTNLLQTTRDRLAELQKTDAEQKNTISSHEATIAELLNSAVPRTAGPNQNSGLVKELSEEIHKKRERFANVIMQHELEASKSAEGLKKARAEIKDLKTAEAETWELMKQHENETTRLDAENKKLRRALEDCEAANRKHEEAADADAKAAADADADDNEFTRSIKEAIRSFLTIKTPSTADIDRLITNLRTLYNSEFGGGSAGLDGAQADKDKDKCLEECEAERKRLREENKRLKDDKKRLEDDKKRLKDDKKRLKDEKTELEAENTRLSDANEAFTDQVATLTATVEDQSRVIETSKQAATSSKTTLSKLLDELERAQQELRESLQAVSEGGDGQGGDAAAGRDRMMTRIRAEIVLFQSIYTTVRVERDQRHDEILAYRDAQERVSERVRELAAMAEKRKGGDGGSGRRRHGRSRAVVKAVVSDTYRVYLEKLRTTWVWSTLLGVFLAMVFVTIAETSLFGKWRSANADSRALWMRTRDRPAICLALPEFDYFWHTVAVIFSGERGLIGGGDI